MGDVELTRLARDSATTGWASLRKRALFEIADIVYGYPERCVVDGVILCNGVSDETVFEGGPCASGACRDENGASKDRRVLQYAVGDRKWILVDSDGELDARQALVQAHEIARLQHLRWMDSMADPHEKAFDLINRLGSRD